MELPAYLRRWGAATLGLAVIGCAAFLISQRPPGPETTRLQIEDGDSISRLFARAGLADSDLLALMEAERGAAFGLALVPGEEVRIIRREDGSLDRLLFGNGDREATAFISDELNRFHVASAPPLKEGEPEGPAAVGATGSVARNHPATRREGTPPRATEDPDASPRVVAGRSGSPELASANLPAGNEEDPRPDESMERIDVRNGDSLYRIFNRNGLSQTDLQHLLASGGDGKKLKRLRPGQSIAFRREPNGQISRFHHVVDALTTVEFTRAGDGFTSRVVTREYDRHIAVKNGVIKSSLFAAAGGVPDQVIHQLVDVLGWDIDFARDLRRGDSFSLLYEELHIDGRQVRTGDVLALEFRSQRAGEPIRAFRYTDSNGATDYFTPDGRSLRRAFMRNPLRFNRISSRFSKSRLHPVLRIRRPHRGVDYAAPRGTAVRATGSGHVSFVGRKSGFGKTIVLTHGNGYTTLYAHLSRYAKGARKGKQVQQGQLIGYVGSTGVSTGPHLHYEFRINGVHRDPLTVALPRAAPLDKEEMKRFRRTIGPLVARIDNLGATQLASLDR
jgi:murein DD-endopeptidase MepM/ murein hydrolase activator NlpD